MRPLFFSLIAAAALAVSSRLVAQDHAVALPGSTDARANVAANNQNAANANATPRPGDSTTEGDDTLYRGKTSDMATTLMRDEGALHFKPRAKEKVHQVDTLKDLQTSGSDAKFQSSLLHNSVTSIEDVGAKPAEGTKLQAPGAPASRRHQVFAVPDDSAKTGQAKAESSPSPSPSVTASPTPGH